MGGSAHVAPAETGCSPLGEGPAIGAYGLEDDLLDGVAADGRTRVRIYGVPRALVVLGRASRPAVELNLDACLVDGVPLLRRRGGGCAVLIDRGSVLIAAAMAVPGIGENQEHFDRLNDWLIDGLARIGVTGIRGEGISDLVRGDRKVAGSCLYRRKGLLLYSASLMVEPDIGRMERYLAHPPREPAYRRGRPHGEFVVGVAEGHTGIDRDGVARDLASALGAPGVKGVTPRGSATSLYRVEMEVI